VKLADIASFVKSANAGATLITFDIGFPDNETFRRVLRCGALSPEAIAKIYRLKREQVRIYEYAPASTIKITLPRPSMTGGIDERDFDGVQQFAPLLDIEVNVEECGGLSDIIPV